MSGDLRLVVSSGPVPSGYVTRKALLPFSSVGATAGFAWLVFLAQARPENDSSSLGFLALSLIIGILSALISPGAGLRQKGVRRAGNIARLVIISGVFGFLWLVLRDDWQYAMGPSAAEPVLYHFGTLMGGVIFYIGIRSALGAVSRRAFDRNILIIGDEQPVQAIQRLFERDDGIRYGVKTGILIRRSDNALDDEIIRLVASDSVNEIVIAFRDRRGDNIAMSTLLDLRMRGIKIWDSTRFIEHETGRVEVEELHPGWIVYSEGFKRSARGAILKRAVDIVFSVIALTICIPVMLLTAIAIKLWDSGPVIYRQRRVGYAGKPFTLYKFRSMIVAAEESGKPMWTMQHDSRITHLGRFIRATRIDELPQLINVLRGEMSLVGPRPERPEFVSVLKTKSEYYDLRHSILPGVTGWAQINVGYTSDIVGSIRKLCCDLYYIKHASIWLDMYIIARTLKTIIWSEGAR